MLETYINQAEMCTPTWCLHDKLANITPINSVTL